MASIAATSLPMRTAAARERSEARTALLFALFFAATLVFQRFIPAT